MRQFKQGDLSSADIARLLRREGSDIADVLPVAKSILREVEAGKDLALRDLTRKLDRAVLSSLSVSEEEFERAEEGLSPRTKEAILDARTSLRAFHRPQVPHAVEVETRPGVKCRLLWRPVQRVGIYIPGGSAPLVSTVLMVGIPAVIAGCDDIVFCTPPNQDGGVTPEILFAVKSLGLKKVFKVGGAQAIAAMALGTESIPKVGKIFGPGNRYVTAMKSIVAQPPYNVAIDMLAGPSELLIIADETADPRWVAADLLSQAEHGTDSAVVLVASSEGLFAKVQKELDIQLTKLPRQAMAARSLENGFMLLVSDLQEALAFSNSYAPEHLILAVKDPDTLASGIVSAGSVFLGSLSSVVFGDYASGTNHTLPTGGLAVSFGGLTVRDFMKSMFFQSITPEGLAALSPTVKTLARAEQLEGHARAVEIREMSSD
ncbi:MAG TPA: histidinol dehydrogenase [Bacteroidota bacterium]